MPGKNLRISSITRSAISESLKGNSSRASSSITRQFTMLLPAGADLGATALAFSTATNGVPEPRGKTAAYAPSGSKSKSRPMTILQQAEYFTEPRTSLISGGRSGIILKAAVAVVQQITESALMDSPASVTTPLTAPFSMTIRFTGVDSLRCPAQAWARAVEKVPRPFSGMAMCSSEFSEKFQSNAIHEAAPDCSGPPPV